MIENNFRWVMCKKARQIKESKLYRVGALNQDFIALDKEIVYW